MTESDDDFFDPEELEEIAQLMDSIMSNEAVGYEMVFWINKSEAQNLVGTYERFKAGSMVDAIKCIAEFAKIIEQLKRVIEDDEEGGVWV